MGRNIRLCDNLDCWNTVEKAKWELKNKHFFCCKQCWKIWLSTQVSGDKNPAKRDESRKNISIGVRKYLADHPESVVRWSVLMQSDDIKAKSLETRLAFYKTQESKLKRSASRKRLWQTSEYRDKCTGDNYFLRRDGFDKEKWIAKHRIPRNTSTKKLISAARINYLSTHALPFGCGRGKRSWAISMNGVVGLKSFYESRYAGVLNVLGIQWEYEKRFSIDSLSHTYHIDFYLPEYDIYVETKGWISEKGKNMMIEFYKQYPNIKLLMVWDDKKNGNHISELEHELGCYAPIDITTVGIDLKEQISLWSVDGNQ